MNKFNIGDKVEVVDEDQNYPTYTEWAKNHSMKNYTEYEYNTAPNGTAGVIIAHDEHEYHHDYLYGIRTEDGKEYILSEHGLKLVQQTPKSMLKNGMRVRLRNGLLYTYIDGYFTNIRTKKGGLNYLSKVDEWGDNLNYYTDGEECMWDVMEIFASSYIFDYFNYKNVTKSLWKREDGTESEKQLKILQDQIQTLTEQAIKLGEQIKSEKL